jgi:hypothetical protein
MNNKCIVLMLLGSLPVGALAMQPLDDAGLAQATGQDGISISLNYPNSTINVSELALIDQNGIAGSTTHTAAASLVMAPTTYSSTQGIRFFNDVTLNNAATQPITIVMDTDGNAGKPLLNMSIGLPSDMRRIRIDPFSIYAATGSVSIYSANRILNGATPSLRATGVNELLRVGTQGIDITFTNSPVRLNLQLGNAPQAHMFVFSSGSLLRIGNDASGANPIQIMSKNSSGNSSLKLDFSLSANNQTTGFQLAGFYGDFDNDSFVFGRAGTTDKMDLVISNLVAGSTTAPADVNSFAGLKNASMGNIGLIGATVTNLKVNVKGL